MDSTSLKDEVSSSTPGTLNKRLSISSLNSNFSKPSNQGFEDPLIAFRMLEALRKGDEPQILQLWPSWPTPPPQESDGQNHLSTSPLHLAVNSATTEINKFILTKLKGININQQDASGNTALHLASKGGRADIVDLLLVFPDVDDSILNSQGKSPLDLAKSSEVTQVFQVSRQEFINDKTIFLDHHLSQATQSNVKAIYDLFKNNPRSIYLDINHRHPVTGSTALHQAVTLGDPELTTGFLKLGANIFARDKRGKAALDMARNEEVKKIVREQTTSSVVASDLNQPPKLEGQLKKWTNYASGYRTRWFTLELGIMSYFRSQDNTADVMRGALNVVNSDLWIDPSDATKFILTGKDKSRFTLRASMLAEAKMWIVAITQTKEWYKKHSKSLPGHDISISVSDTSPNTSSQDLPQDASSSNVNISLTSFDPDHDSLKPVATTRSRSNSASSSFTEMPPSEEEVTVAINSLETQFDLHQRLLDMLKNSLTSPGSKLEDQMGLLSTISQCLASIRSIHTESTQMLQKRKDHFNQLYKKESKQNDLWTESLQSLAAEHQTLSELYQEEHQKIKVPENGKEASSLEVIPEAEPEPILVSFDDDDEDEFFDLDEDGPELENEIVPNYENEPLDPSISEINQEKVPVQESLEEVVLPTTKFTRVPIKKSYQGYPKDGILRDRLPKFDEKTKPPSVSLWSVLKNAIGKDLTKITLPVHFNEPSSMLQRMGEDMEYSRLLDLASKQVGDGAERLLWITAFAMSNYSSTDGRIAKPFNPLLGETFEYVRPDRNFRYVSEQVSHHPPISACFCESPNYIFFSEVDVKSNFWGKSYELLPQGVCHVYLFPEDGTVEHYTWKKVTTAVTNLIVGNPTIESYGDMVVVNHSTKAKCTLTFKPNRWLSSERHSLEGVVTTANGQNVWKLSGAWHQELIATRLDHASPSGPEDLGCDEPDTPGSKLSKFLANPTTCPSVRLWKRSPLPKNPLPFKLTPFALTLNDFPPGLDQVLPPTDCRRRPDQRAMEDGLYDEASVEKNRLEEKQRATRKVREAELQEALASAPATEHARIKEELGFKPQWFVRDTDPDTNEPFWRFTHHYWKLRDQATNLDKDHAWPNIPRIF